MFDLNPGPDGVIGSSDDVRGDDVNLHWFRMSNNNPFTIAPTVDSSTYTRNIANLPSGHTFPANADFSVSSLLGVPNTEAVMQQRTFLDEAQRTLAHDDVATFQYAMAGLDETAGTADDYTVTLTYAGLTTSANIVLDFDNSQTAFAVSVSSGVFLTGTHAAITSTAVYFNNGVNWFFTNAPTHTLTVTKAGAGSGVVSSSPAGISCGSDCTQTYDAGTDVTLVPAPVAGSVFAGWAGDTECRDGVVTMNAAHSCTAVFLTALGTGATRGTVDLNGDSGADSFRYDATTGAWAMDFGDRLGAFSTRTGSWSPGWTIQAADFDGNGLTDFFLYNPTSGQWFKAIGTGAADFTYFGSFWSSGWSVVIVDFNGDGRSDVFLYNDTTGQWFRCTSLGAGTGEFAYVPGAWSPDWQIHPVEFNGDGRTDLFLYNTASGQWFRAIDNGGSGFLYSTEVWSPNWQITPGDFNGDGRSDLFLYNPVSGQWFVATDTGSGFSYTTEVWSPGWTIRPGDFNADGRTDLFVYNATTGQWFECFSTGAGGFTYASGSWSPSWDVHVTDFNADRRADVLLYNATSGQYFQAINTGPGSFFYATGNWGLGWTIIATRTSTP